MDEKRIEEIVRKVFEKAKKEHAHHSRFALSNHISEHSELSSKTLERVYDRYIDKKGNHGIPHADSVRLFCKYLGFEAYADYVKRYPSPYNGNGSKKSGSINLKKISITISIVFGIVLMFFGIQKWTASPQGNNSEGDNCMTWADSLYVAVSCDSGPFSKYGTKVEPINPFKLEKFKKVEVNAAYLFFSEETNNPLIWYFKNKDDEFEYYTAPGLHPTTGETLRKITPYIIQTYVPMHTDQKSSFVQ